MNHYQQASPYNILWLEIAVNDVYLRAREDLQRLEQTPGKLPYQREGDAAKPTHKGERITIRLDMCLKARATLT